MPSRDPELPKFFAELPRRPYGIREIPAFRGETAAHYTPGTSDGSRAGFFNANTLKGTTRPRHEMEALLLHETVPGHHLQVARAQELKGLPDFRRNAFYNAYIEGWGLYAESLATIWGFTRTRTRGSAGFRAKSSVPAALSSTPACTPWPGLVNKPSII